MTIPADAEEVEFEVEGDVLDGEWEHEFEGADDDGEDEAADDEDEEDDES